MEDKVKELRDYLISHSDCQDCFHCMYMYHYADECKECNVHLRDKFRPEPITDEIYTKRAEEIIKLLNYKSK